VSLESKNTDPIKVRKNSSNILERNFKAAAPNQKMGNQPNLMYQEINYIYLQ
jgi:hypothetical protein